MTKTVEQLKEEAIKSGMPEKDAEEMKQSIEDADETHKRVEEEANKVKNDEMKIILGETFEEIKAILREFCDLKEEYYDLIAVWVIGTYVYDCFNTFPYLFINASRGSGKTRLLKLITALSKDGMLITSVREAVLFRIAKGKTLAIDEFEGIKRKENAPLRELLNACYKKGMKVIRMQRRKTPEGEQYIAEEFEPFTPIVMANIEGMDEVVGDRCIQLMLEKSSNKVATRLMEDFDDSLRIKKIKQDFDLILVYMCMCMSSHNTMLEWNSYIKFIYDYNTYNSRKWLNHYCHCLGDKEKVSCECMFDRSRQRGYFTYDQLFEYLDCHSNSGEWEDGTEEENIELQKRWRYNMIMHYYVRDIKTGEIYSLESIINNS